MKKKKKNEYEKIKKLLRKCGCDMCKHVIKLIEQGEKEDICITKSKEYENGNMQQRNLGRATLKNFKK